MVLSRKLLVLPQYRTEPETMRKAGRAVRWLSHRRGVSFDDGGHAVLAGCGTC